MPKAKTPTEVPNLRAARETAHITVAKLATLLNVAPATIDRWERAANPRPPRPVYLAIIRRILPAAFAHPPPTKDESDVHDSAPPPARAAG